MSEIKLETERFGELSIPEERLIRFVEPILGFENSSTYVLLDHSADSPFKWLQSVEESSLAFVVTNPKFFGLDYEFEIADDLIEQLSIQKAEDVLVLTIVNIPADDPGKMTANLLGPIIINQNNCKAMQVVLNDSEFSTKTRLLPDELLNQKVDAEQAHSPAGGQ